MKILGLSELSEDTMTRSQAYRLYGRDNVDRWCLEGLIHPVFVRGGKKKFIDRLKLEAVARADHGVIALSALER